ncbi:TetR/AcrR family transcriptional regulator [Vibrio marisflavi]|uniref:HTH tetR-type domain-containing protein n=1 Tax=Vibrio marisflavi CECT 7928 TaxID=634439 RepID=A0ABM9A3D8_9VIBR|nr:TetR/AcrR family transcriptional regulator [Vibrio marisflavi]CAH0539117.1 hypothetical protein VMF7928_01915 [Vibrio marisflavi CECT 7928]
MSLEKRRVGRPSAKDNNIDIKAKLLECACHLFATMPYEKVSIRLVSLKAGVSSSLIRYYFGDKEGLLEEVVQSVVFPIYSRVHSLAENTTYDSFIELFEGLYAELTKGSYLPKIVFQFMVMPPSDSKRQLVERIIAECSKPLQDVIFEQLVENKILRPDVDPSLCRLSWLSLMMFPFIVPPALMKLHDMELTDEFLDRFFRHNMNLMMHGFIQAPVHIDNECE